MEPKSMGKSFRNDVCNTAYQWLIDVTPDLNANLCAKPNLMLNYSQHLTLYVIECTENAFPQLIFSLRKAEH
jgi:hypothetical protein